MKYYSVARLARLAGVSVRTLHLYDQIKLLIPSHRSEAGYRMYGEPELLRLQQILFYKELGLSLQEIAAILDDPEFDLIQGLEGHRQALAARQRQIQVMLATIDKTIQNLKKQQAMEHEALYEGLSREEATAYRSEAIRKYGKDAVERSEKSMKEMAPEELETLKAEQKELDRLFAAMQHQDPESDEVQALVSRHYQMIRRFWGTHESADKQAEAYKGLADLYIHDERFLQTDGKARPELARFLKKAITYFAGRSLQ